ELNAARQLLMACEPDWKASERHRAARLWRQLETQAGHPERTVAHWERLSQQHTDDLHLQLLLAEEALAQGDHPATQQYEEQLLNQEGEDGSAWRYVRARRLLMASKQPRSAEVRRLAEWLTARRPGWINTWIL